MKERLISEDTELEKILVVAESKEIQREISSLLALRYNLIQAFSAEDAKQKVDAESHDLILIATQLPDYDGFRLCALLRNQEKTQTTPIILIDPDLNPHARATAFSMGANDLVKIPINAVEFLAQVSAKIQFRKAFTRTTRTTSKGPFMIDLENQKVSMIKDGDSCELDLTPIEFKMFVLFTNNEGQPLSREKIRTTIWGKTVHIESRSIDKHVSSLRRKISPFEDCILTTPGLGYSFALIQSLFKNANNL